MLYLNQLIWKIIEKEYEFITNTLPMKMDLRILRLDVQERNLK